MRRGDGASYIFKLVLGASAFALALAVTIPHYHDQSSVPRHGEGCRVCRIQDGFAATPVSVSSTPTLHGWLTGDLLPPNESPRVVSVVRLASPRAPPVLS